jgi:hypothetical protein
MGNEKMTDKEFEFDFIDPNFNFTFWFGDNENTLQINLNQKKSLKNRIKWWLFSKLFPVNHRWWKDESK